MSEEALVYLQRQRWPGNVRQLMHTVERAVIFSESDVIEPEDFGLPASAAGQVSVEVPPAEPGSEAPDAADSGVELVRVSGAVKQVEEQLIRQAMVRCQGNKKRVAVELGISRSYLYKRLAEIGLANDSGS
jgi:DNA-binding NtrC family response regulator